jgi:Holliday junction DNA helicase RuvB
MEDGVVDVSAGRRTIRLPLQPFTLVGATTRTHLLTGPLRDRFAYTFNLGCYSAEDLATIAARTARRLGLAMHEAAAAEIGRRSRGTPRIANNRVRACRDYAQSAGLQHVDRDVACEALAVLGIDALGLDANDRAYLRVLADAGKPVGVGTLAAQLGQERGTIEAVVEPYLLETGLVRRTPSGRVATPAATAHLLSHERMTVEPRTDVPELTS